MPSADPAQFPMETKCAPMLFRRTARRGACQRDDSPERQLIPLCSGNDIALNEPPVQPSTEGEFRPCQSFAEQCLSIPGPQAPLSHYCSSSPWDQWGSTC